MKIIDIKRNIKQRLHLIPRFARCGIKFHIGENWIVNNAQMIEIGDNVSIGPNVVLYSIYKRIIFGNNIVLGPHVTMVSGDHNISTIGVSIIDNCYKAPEDDADIIIEDDVWIGANVTILKGVIIRRGTVVGAGAVVTRSTLPYSIYGGIPAKKIGVRFKTIDDIQKHENLLYSIQDRLNVNDLRYIFEK